MKKRQLSGTPDVNQTGRVTLANDVSREMEERKSIFIGHAAPVSSEEEARRYVDEKKSRYYDATHNVYAYMLNNGAVGRYSDDGEPQGTAGLPVFNAVKMSGACDLVVVVTRYFGGILLGASGLVRAYSAAARLALDAAGRAVFEAFSVFSVRVSYTDYQRLVPAFEKIGVAVDNESFEDKVTLQVAVQTERGGEIDRIVSEMTAGKGTVLLLRQEERMSQTV